MEELILELKKQIIHCLFLPQGEKNSLIEVAKRTAIEFDWSYEAEKLHDIMING